MGRAMLKDYIFTSESVTEGHPDKMADQISDSILDAMLAQDPNSRVACETMITTGLVVLGGEITSTAQIDFQDVVRQKIRDIGYDHSDKGFDADTCAVMVTLDKQSPHIAQGVNVGEGTHKEQGAGDQGLMFGYAVNETDTFMPLTTDLSHQMALKLSQIRKNGICSDLRADGKTQISAQYVDGRVTRLDAIVVSTQHAESLSLSKVEEVVREEVIKKVVPAHLIDNKTNIYVNPTGKFVIGGPMGDCGLTGRKIIVDTYGGHGAHGGGAFSGKDASKVDRSAAYATRQVAKHIVAAGLAEKALVQVAYAIGVARPMSFLVDTFGTETVDLKKINSAVNEVFDMRPRAIIERLDLLKPIFAQTAAYGHFGRRDIKLPWEQLTLLEALKAKF
jgi:S-adenosylmethionine synthetase